MAQCPVCGKEFDTERGMKIHKSQVHSEKETDKEKKEPKKKEEKCHYHMCDKEGKVYRCQHCSEYFCEEHLVPKPPATLTFKRKHPEQTLSIKGGHPCIPFGKKWREEQKKKEEERDKAFDKALSETKETTITESKGKTRSKKSKIKKAAIIGIILAVITGILIFLST